MPAATYGFGGYVRLEPWYMIAPRLSTGERPGLFYLHGAGGEETALWPTWSPNSSRLMWWQSEFYPVFAPDSSTDAQTNGAHTWGNDASVATLDAAITYAQSLPELQMAPGPVVLIGASMGHVLACNYALQHPTKVAGIIGLAGASDIDYHYANGYAVNIDAAYGGSWANNGKLPVSHNPIDFADQLMMPHAYWYADDDTTVPPTGVGSHVPFQSKYGGSTVAYSMGTGGHSDTPLANVDRMELLSHIKQAFG